MLNDLDREIERRHLDWATNIAKRLGIPEDDPGIPDVGRAPFIAGFEWGMLYARKLILESLMAARPPLTDTV